MRTRSVFILSVLAFVFFSSFIDAEIHFYSGGRESLTPAAEIPENADGSFLLTLESSYRFLLIKVAPADGGRSVKQVYERDGNTVRARITFTEGPGRYRITVYGAHSRNTQYAGLGYFFINNRSNARFIRIKRYSSRTLHGFAFDEQVSRLPDAVRGRFRLSGRLSSPFLMVRTRKGRYQQKEVIRVSGGRFSFDLHLPFGAGRYETTLFAANGRTQRYKGLAQLEYSSTDSRDRTFLAPTLTVNYNHPDLSRLAARIARGKSGKMAIIRSAYTWVTANIAYDTSKSLRGRASDIYRWRRAVCSGYASLLAALLRPHGIRVRIVTGWGRNERHAWNQIRIDGRWINADATWDAGYVRNRRFYRRSKWKYFDMGDAEFLRNHRSGVITYR